MKIKSLTIFRFLAASIVVIFHYGKNTTLANIAPGFLTAGPEMVSFFFVLSGFVMMIANWDRQLEPAKYYRERFARIAPTYYMAFLIALFVETAVYGRRAVVFNALFLQAWFPPYPVSINGPSWSLSVEMFFYLTFPLLWGMLKPKRLNPIIVMVSSFFVWLFSQLVLMNLLNSPFYKPYPSIPHDLIFYFPLSHFSSFLLGVSGGYLYMSNKRKVKWRSWPLFAGSLVTCTLIFLALSSENLLTKSLHANIPFDAGVFAPLFLLLILMASLTEETFSTHQFNFRLFVLLGDASYAVYMLQRPFHQIFEKYVFPWLSLSDEYLFYLYFICLVVFSVLVFLWFEKPVKRLLVGKMWN